MKKHVLRIDEDVIERVKNGSIHAEMTLSAFAKILIVEGLKSYSEGRLILAAPPTSAVSDIYEGAKEAAESGTAALSSYMRNLTPQEEQRIKYDIKALKAIAARSDASSILDDIDDFVKEGDRICLDGNEKFNAWYNGLDKTLRDALKEHLKGWKFDATRSDEFVRIEPESGRPTERFWHIHKGRASNYGDDYLNM